MQGEGVRILNIAAGALLSFWAFCRRHTITMPSVCTLGGSCDRNLAIHHGLELEAAHLHYCCTYGRLGVLHAMG